MTQAARIENKVAVVTGGANGIGAGVARRLARDGARVVVADLDATRGGEVAAEIGGLFCRTDVTDPQANVALVESAVHQFGRLDIAVLNAGIVSDLTLDAGFDPVAYRRLMAINFDGVVYGMAAAFPVMAAQGFGDILVTASMAGIAPTPLEPLYAASKTGLVGLVRSFGLASIQQGVRVNAICPAFADTALISHIADGLVGAGVPLLDVETVVDSFTLALASEESGQCWFVQPGRPSEPFTFRGAPGPRLPEGGKAAAADPDVQLRIDRKLAEQ